MQLNQGRQMWGYRKYLSAGSGPPIIQGLIGETSLAALGVWEPWQGGLRPFVQALKWQHVNSAFLSGIEGGLMDLGQSGKWQADTWSCFFQSHLCWKASQSKDLEMYMEVIFQDG